MRRSTYCAWASRTFDYKYVPWGCTALKPRSLGPGSSHDEIIGMRQQEYEARYDLALQTRTPLQLPLSMDGCRRTTEFSSEAGCEDFMPRKAVMPAPSAATAGSACPWLVEHHRTTSPPRRQPRGGQPCRGQAYADTPAAPRRAGTRRQPPGGACPRRSAVRSPPAASGSAPR